ncbi:MAG TPA: hypothetical protein VD963_06295 [Phycisphaerales bacterium]|nr:hypothetical protein [Phycisphaerales bacterium]
MKKVVALLAVAGAAAAANAQTFDAQVRFAQGHTGSPTVLGSIVDITGSPLLHIPLTLQGGAFNAVGFDNQGLISLNGQITATGLIPGDTLLEEADGDGRVPPFNFGPIGTGTLVSPGLMTDVNPFRAIQTIVWPVGAPQPNPDQRGDEAYTNTFRFFLDVADTTTPRDIVVTFSGAGEAAANWTVLASTPPDPDEGTPGSVQYAAQPVVDPATTGSVTFRIIPAPGAAALLGLGGLLAARRRR